MQASDPLTIMVATDRWATLQLFDACNNLTTEQFHQPFEMGPGSLHNTLSHLTAAMRAWTDSLAGQTPTPRIDQDGQKRTSAELRALYEAAWKDFSAECTRLPLDQTISRQLRNGPVITLTRGVAVTQVTTHGMHHRAQCLNMLRHVGVKPLPPSSALEWAMMAK